MTCALCGEEAPEGWLYFVGVDRKHKRVKGQIPLCQAHSEMIYKHLKRQIPKALFTAVTMILLLAAPLHAQTRADTVQTELVRLRGFIRAAETQATKALGLLAPLTTQPEGPPVVLDWRTGEWDALAGGYRIVLDLDRGTATAQEVTAPVTAQAVGDTLRVRLGIPGYADAGLLELVHAEGRMIGTVRYGDEERPASAQRLALQVVRTVRRSPCVFAQYTDGSWGISPNTGECHQALDAYAGPLRYVARVYYEP